MATKRAKMAQVPATLDQVIASGWRSRPLEDPAQAEPEQPTSLTRRILGDGGISLLKGAVGVPEAAVGLADLATGGRVGKALEDGVTIGGVNLGFRPKMAKEALDQMLTPEQQKANREVQEAQGFLDTTMAALRNPSTILHAATESLPVMGGGAVVGRALMAGTMRAAPGLAARIGAAEAAPLVASQGAQTAAKYAPVLAGAAGEGVTTMGSQAESIRQETPDGLLTGQQSALAAGSGFITGGLSVLGGAVAAKLGIHDIDTLLQGKHSPEVTKSFARRVLEGAVSEGLLEELPQSVQEQVAQNLALGKPLGEGVNQAAVLGMFSGGLMGGGSNIKGGGKAPVSAASQIRQEKQPNTGPVAKSLNAGLEDAAQQADAIERASVPAVQPQPVPTQPVEQPMPAAAVPQVADPVLEAAPAQPAPEFDAAAFEQRQADKPPEPAVAAEPGERVLKDMDTAMRAKAKAGEGAVMVPVTGGGAVVRKVDAETGELMPASPPRQTVGKDANSFTNSIAQASRDQADRLGLTGTIEGLFAQGLTAAQVTNRLGSNEKFLKVPHKERAGLVIGTRATLGIPSQADEEGKAEFAAWKAAYDKRAAPTLPGVEAAPPAPPVAPPAAALPDDTLNAQGKPFTNRGAAANKMRALGEEYTIAAVDGGFAVRKLAMPAAHATESPHIDEAAHQAASSPLNALPEPTDAQKEAGNYKVGRVRLSGMDVSIETPKGAERRSKADAPQPWKVTMPAHYGYIRGTTGADGDHVDLFIGDKGDNGRFWVINQTTPDGKTFDEHKVVTGVESADEAVALYKASFADGFGDKVFHSVTREKAADEIRSRLDEFSKPKPIDGTDASIPQVLTSSKGASDEAKPVDVAGAAAGPDPVPGGDGADSQAPVAQALTARDVVANERGLPAVKQQLHVEGPDGKKYPVADIAEAQAKWEEFRDASGGGASDVGNGVRVLDQDGKFVARISYNGRVWTEEDPTPSPANAPKAAPAAAGSMSPVWDSAKADEREQYLLKAGWHKGGPGTEALKAKKWDGLTTSQKARVSIAIDSALAPAAAPAQAPKALASAPAPAAPAAPAAPKRSKAAQKAADSRIDTLKAYFKPGNVVKSYGGGFDEVLSLDLKDDGGFSVKVHPVTKGQASGQWVRLGKPQDARQHSTFPDGREIAAGPVAQLMHVPGDQVSYTEGRADGQPFPNAPDRGVKPEAAPAPEPVSAKESAPEIPVSETDKGKPAPSANTIVTEDAADRARALLRKKLGNINSGLDPEVLQAGITLAAYHVERGARKFSAYAKAMVQDLGDIVKPYLQSWYMAMRSDPAYTGLRDGMDKASAVEDLTAEQIDAMVSEPAKTEPAPAEPPAEAPDKPARNEAEIELRKRVSVLESLRRCIG